MGDFNQWTWLNEPQVKTIQTDRVTIQTEPGTDLWQRTYYGFQNDNAPALMFETDKDSFSFVVRTDFDSKVQYDQCGVLIYQNSDNWFKASTEYENDMYQRLGSVVTNRGYSDWATTDIPAIQKSMYYRLSRHGSDFRIENSLIGVHYKQMRIFHLFEGIGKIKIGIYACSPSKSSFTAEFTEMQMVDCQWKVHGE